MVVTTKDDPVVCELTATLCEWHQIWTSLYLDNNTELVERIGALILDLADAREELIQLLREQQQQMIECNPNQIITPSPNLTRKPEIDSRTQQISELKSDTIAKIDLGNQILGLDLVLRDSNFKPVFHLT